MATLLNCLNSGEQEGKKTRTKKGGCQPPNPPFSAVLPGPEQWVIKQLSLSFSTHSMTLLLCKSLFKMDSKCHILWAPPGEAELRELDTEAAAASSWSLSFLLPLPGTTYFKIMAMDLPEWKSLRAASISPLPFGGLMPCIEYSLCARPCLTLILSLLREHDHSILQMRRLTCLVSHKW